MNSFSLIISTLKALTSPISDTIQEAPFLLPLARLKSDFCPFTFLSRLTSAHFYWASSLTSACVKYTGTGCTVAPSVMASFRARLHCLSSNPSGVGQQYTNLERLSGVFKGLASRSMEP